MHLTPVIEGTIASSSLACPAMIMLSVGGDCHTSKALDSLSESWGIKRRRGEGYGWLCRMLGRLELELGII